MHIKCKIAVSIVSALGLYSCTNIQPHSNIQPTYTVVSDLDYTPYITQEEGVIQGLETDILTAIAKSQGFSIQYRQSTWDTLFDDMQKHQADIAINGMAINDINTDVANYSKPYLRSLDCIATTDQQQLTQWQKAKIAAVFEGNLVDSLQTNHQIKPEQFVEVGTQQQGLTEVAQGRVALMAGDCTALRYYSKHSDQLKKYLFFIQELDTSGSADNSNLVFAVNKNNPELLRKINIGLDELSKNGELARIKQKWGQ